MGILVNIEIGINFLVNVAKDPSSLFFGAVEKHQWYFYQIVKFEGKF